MQINKTKISGLLQIKLDVLTDVRGDFTEVYQADKLRGLGFDTDFKIVQMNRSRNLKKGTTRGIHAEPWEKYISVVTGRIFAAIVELREGENFGRVETFNLGPDEALFVPRGCGNSYQTLEDDTCYTYLVNAHWSKDGHYKYVNLTDPKLNISWPIALSEAIISEKDLSHPNL